jgi:hypothetical protein
LEGLDSSNNLEGLDLSNNLEGLDLSVGVRFIKPTFKKILSDRGN